MEKTFYFSMQGQQYSESQEVAIPKDCNGMTLINRGDGLVYVNNIPLSPNPVAGTAGEAISLGGNLGEVYAGRLNIAFDTQAAPLLIVVFKYYVNPNLA